MSYYRPPSPGSRRLQNPARLSDSFLPEPYYNSRTQYNSPRHSAERVIPISSQTFVNGRPLEKVYETHSSGRPRRSTVNESHRPSVPPTSHPAPASHSSSRSKPAIIQSNRATSPLPPRKDSNRDAGYYSDAPKKEHKKVYSVDDGKTKLVAEHDVKPRQHSRRPSVDRAAQEQIRRQSQDRGGYTTSDHSRRGKDYHLSGPLVRTKDASEDEFGWSYTDPAGMYRETEPRWRRRQGSVDARDRPTSMSFDNYTARPPAIREPGPPPSTRGFTRLNDGFGIQRSNSSRQAARPSTAANPYDDSGYTSQDEYGDRSRGSKSRQLVVPTSEYEQIRSPSHTRYTTMTAPPERMLDRPDPYSPARENIREPVRESIRQPPREYREPIREPVREPIREPIREPVRELPRDLRETTREPVREPLREPIREPIRDLPREVRESVRDPVREPLREQIPVRDLAREPIREPVREQTREPLRDPVRDPIRLDKFDDRRDSARYDERRDTAGRDRYEERRDPRELERRESDRAAARRRYEDQSVERRGFGIRRDDGFVAHGSNDSIERRDPYVDRPVPPLEQRETPRARDPRDELRREPERPLANDERDERERIREADAREYERRQEKDRRRAERAERAERDDYQQRSKESLKQHQDSDKDRYRDYDREDRPKEDRRRDRERDRREDRGRDRDPYESGLSSMLPAAMATGLGAAAVYGAGEIASKDSKKPREHRSSSSSEEESGRDVRRSRRQRERDPKADRSPSDEERKNEDTVQESASKQNGDGQATLDADEEYRRRLLQAQQEAMRPKQPEQAQFDRPPIETDRETDFQRRENKAPSAYGAFDETAPPRELRQDFSDSSDRAESVLDRGMTSEPAEIIDNSASRVRENRVRIVEPPTEKEQPIRGILKKPKESFPEDPNPIREGVAPLKDAKQKGIPPGARWTKIDRKLVNPDALEEAKLRYEERADCVIVLRVLTKEDIQKLAVKTQEIRDARRDPELFERRERRKRDKEARRREKDEYEDENSEFEFDPERKKPPRMLEAPSTSSSSSKALPGAEQEPLQADFIRDRERRRDRDREREREPILRERERDRDRDRERDRERDWDSR